MRREVVCAASVSAEPQILLRRYPRNSREHFCSGVGARSCMGLFPQRRRGQLAPGPHLDPKKHPYHRLRLATLPASPTRSKPLRHSALSPARAAPQSRLGLTARITRRSPCWRIAPPRSCAGWQGSSSLRPSGYDSRGIELRPALNVRRRAEYRAVRRTFGVVWTAISCGGEPVSRLLNLRLEIQPRGVWQLILLDGDGAPVIWELMPRPNRLPYIGSNAGCASHSERHRQNHQFPHVQALPVRGARLAKIRV